MSQQILDLDTFAPQSKMVKFTDRKGKSHTFDISFMSFKSSMFMMANIDKFRALQNVKPEDVDEDFYRLLLGVISEIGQGSDPDLTVDFLLANLSIIQGTMLVESAMDPIYKFILANPRTAEGEREAPSA